MGSVMDWGKAQEQASKVKISKCEKGGEHDWERKGSWPSTWGECKKCGATYFDK